jgi:hypothetical protein
MLLVSGSGSGTLIPETIPSTQRCVKSWRPSRRGGRRAPASSTQPDSKRGIMNQRRRNPMLIPSTRGAKKEARLFCVIRLIEIKAVGALLNRPSTSPIRKPNRGPLVFDFTAGRRCLVRDEKRSRDGRGCCELADRCGYCPPVGRACSPSSVWAVDFDFAA